MKAKRYRTAEEHVRVWQLGKFRDDSKVAEGEDGGGTNTTETIGYYGGGERA